ncbi:MAG: hypothetical protein H6558_16075 [Lewinellaceae bacterium]|nr:hypothetical protein [Lewinellaceae bacterium]MCB9288025.1 hypothetical protein [Lewinellaceae bacterium]
MKNRPFVAEKAILAITVGFIGLYLLTGWSWPVVAAFAVGLAGMLSETLSKKIAFLWMKLAQGLSFVVPNILLALAFFLVLCPFAFLSRLFGKKDPLMLKDSAGSTFREVDKTFDKGSLENTW